MEPVKVGIVMPCINLWAKYTLPALASVASAQSFAERAGIKTAVLLIDNASNDETESQASARAGIEYHRNDEMWGFQKSVNFGVKHFFDKGYDYVLVLNNDIEMHQQAICKLVKRFKNTDKPVGMVTCLDVTGECKRDPRNLYGLDVAEKEKCPETPNPCFSAFMVDRECWDKVGEFDEIFAPAYYEDNDYHYRMQLAGLKAITYPPAMFFHWGSATQLEALGRPLTNSANQHAQYVRKWGGDPGKEIFKAPFNNGLFSIRSTNQNKYI